MGPHFPSRSRRRGGSALIIVLWVIGLLSFLIITALLVAMQDADTTAARKVAFRAKQLAEMGVAVASHPLIKASDPLLRQKLSDTEQFEAMLTSEEGRLNLNALLSAERNAVLERLFRTWGLSEPDAETLVDRLVDWVDQDDFKRLKGGERLDYQNSGFPDRPFNRPFQSVDEAALVAGMEKLTEVRPDWREWFTLRGSGQLDVNEAPAEVIALATGAPMAAVQALVRRRNGADGILHTEDDMRIESVEEASALLGLQSSDQETSGLITVQSSTLRIVSIGRAGELARGIAVVLSKDGGGARILEWREFVVE